MRAKRDKITVAKTKFSQSINKGFYFPDGITSISLSKRAGRIKKNSVNNKKTFLERKRKVTEYRKQSSTAK